MVLTVGVSTLLPHLRFSGVTFDHLHELVPVRRSPDTGVVRRGTAQVVQPCLLGLRHPPLLGLEFYEINDTSVGHHDVGEPRLVPPRVLVVVDPPAASPGVGDQSP